MPDIVVGFMTDFGRNKLIAAVFRKVAFTLPDLYCGLSTAIARKDRAPAELPFSNGYARVAISATNFSDPVNGQSQTTAPITFPGVSGADWPAFLSFVLYDAPTGGNPWCIVGATGNPIYLTRRVGDPPLVIPAGGLMVGWA